jgi:hypothetical protein
MHLSELKELNESLFKNIPSAKTARFKEFEERVYVKIREMSFRGAQVGFVKSHDIDCGTAIEFRDLVNSIHMSLLPYFKLTQVRSDVRIDAIQI